MEHYRKTDQANYKKQWFNNQITIRSYFLGIYKPNTGSRLSKILVVDKVQLCYQILLLFNFTEKCGAATGGMINSGLWQVGYFNSPVLCIRH